ncbi:MAG: MlaD family protein [Bacteroidota bacterium]|nr:MlaD family protein [Bacteroidota bacterium]MDP4233280.1 MlaD family protein [Bacteroidota bacterium]MDP4242100.1 MlaD family protein [Bacteroidota bacterium]MDP4288621.1 MlaD family protein [Bacteroidota bacterium]
MKRKAVPLLRIGIFVLAGFIILIVSIFYLGSKEKLFSSTTQVKSRFSTVSNLKRGAEVDMAGINIGSVQEIRLPRNARDSVTVTMKVLTDAMKLIHTDSKAMITTAGLIGDRLIVITMGSDSTLAVEPGSTIMGQSPQDFSKLYDTLSAVIDQLDSVGIQATRLVKKITEGHGTLAKLVNDDALYVNANRMAANASETFAHARDAVDRMETSVDHLTNGVNDVVQRVNRGEGSLGKLLTKDDVYENARRASENLMTSSYDLHDALAKIALGSGRFAEVMEAFKHNFLVKSYFENRGYWDAPEFEMTIDRKIDSLNHLRQIIDSRSGAQK